MTEIVDNYRTMLKNRMDATQEVVVPLSDATFTSSDGNLYFGYDGDDYKLADGAFQKLMKTLEIPLPYARRIDDDILNLTVNHFIANKVGDVTSMLIEGDSIRAFVDDGHPYVPAYKAFSAIEEVVGGNYDLKYVGLDDSTMKFSLLPEEYVDAVDGSNLFGGLKVSFSDAWAVFPTLDAYIWRELCSNGMIDTLDGVKFRVTGKSEDSILEQIQTFSQLSIEKIPALFSNFELLTKEKVDDWKRLVARICTEYKLSSKVLTRLHLVGEMPEFLVTIRNGGIETMHDVVNLITWVASHDAELPQDVRNRLMEIAGSLTLAHDERCQSCGVIV